MRKLQAARPLCALVVLSMLLALIGMPLSLLSHADSETETAGTPFVPDTAAALPEGAEIWDGVPATSLSGGTGTADDPYRIANAAEFMYFRNTLAADAAETDHYLLTGDVYLNSDLYRSAIGVKPNDLGATFPFAGVLNGNGHTVYNPWSAGEQYSERALFGALSGTVRNLTVRGANLKSINSSCAVFATNLSGTIENCHAIACTLRGFKVGGIAAVATGTSPHITDCTAGGIYFAGCARTGGSGGGILAQYGAGGGTLTVTGCTNYADISNWSAAAANCAIGGIVAYAGADAGVYVSIVRCRNEGTLTAAFESTAPIGGIIGRNYRIRDLLLQECVNRGSILANAAAGGMLGAAHAQNNLSTPVRLINCLNEAPVTSTGDKVGGLVGAFEDPRASLTVTGCVNRANVAGVNAVGGFVGCVSASEYSSARIIASGSASYGSVTATERAGGCVGQITTSRFSGDGLTLNACLLDVDVYALTNAGAAVGYISRRAATARPSDILTDTYIRGTVKTSDSDGVAGVLQGGSDAAAYSLTVEGGGYRIAVFHGGTETESPAAGYYTAYETDAEGTETATLTPVMLNLDTPTDTAFISGTVRTALNDAARSAGTPLWYQSSADALPEPILTLSAPAAEWQSGAVLSVRFSILAPIGIAASDLALVASDGSSYPANGGTGAEGTDCSFLVSIPFRALSLTREFRLSCASNDSLRGITLSLLDLLADDYDTESTDVASVGRAEMIRRAVILAAYAGDSGAIPRFAALTGTTLTQSVDRSDAPVGTISSAEVGAQMSLTESLALTLTATADRGVSVTGHTTTATEAGVRIDDLMAWDLNTPLTLVYTDGTTVNDYTVASCLQHIITTADEPTADLARAAAAYMQAAVVWHDAVLFMEQEGPHTWDAGTVTTAPICIREGVMTYVCAACHATRRDPIPATGNHTPNSGEVTLAPTCETAGTLTSTCTQCDGVMAVTAIPAYGHSWASVDRAQYQAGTFVKPATCKICGTTESHTVTTVNANHTTLYDWEALLSGDNNKISEAWFGFHAAYPRANWTGVVALFRGGTDENGNSLYAYDADEKAITLKFNGTNWQALQFNTNINNSMISEMRDADYGFMQMDIWYEAGSFPGWTLSRDDRIGYIDQSGGCWTWNNHADRSDENRVSFGQLQAGWNTITIVGVAQRNGLGQYTGLDFYLGVGVDASQNFTAASFASMTRMTSLVKNNFANWRNPHQVIFIVPDDGLGTVDAPSEIKLRGLKEGYLTFACPHTSSSAVAAVAPTCTDAGYTAGVICDSCGLWLSGHEKIAASHTWGTGTLIDAGSCTTQERRQYTCVVCDATRYEVGLFRHQYADTWSWDDNAHWHPATCGHDAESARGLHVIGENGVCTVCAAVCPMGGSLSYTAGEGGWYVSGRGSVTGGTIRIPGTYNGLPVIGIAEGAFRNDTALTTLVVTPGLTAIGAGAFGGCTALTTLVLADTVTDVAADAFTGAPIATATLPAAALACIPHGSLTQLEITSGVSLADEALRDVATLTHLTLPRTLKTVGEGAFAGCISLSHIVYRGTMTEWCEIDFLSSPLAGGVTLSFFGGMSYAVPRNLPGQDKANGGKYLGQTEHTLGSAALVGYDTAAYFPSLSTVIAKGRGEVPIYGIYAWTEDYSTYYNAICEIGFTSLRTNSTSMTNERFMKIQRQGISVMVTAGVAATGYLLPAGSEKAAADLTLDDYDVTGWIAANVAKIRAFLSVYGPNGSFFTDTENPYYDELHNEDGTLAYYNPITAIEVYNEPNFGYMTGHSDPWLTIKQSLYAVLQIGVYNQIKAEYPTVRIVGFGAGGASSADVGFITSTLNGNPEAASHMDVLSTHPYLDESSPFAGSNIYGAHSLASQLANIRACLASHGVGDTPIWYTECGWAVKQSEGGYYATEFGTDQETQAAMLVQEYIYGMRVGVERINYMYIMDTDNCNYGILNRDGTWRKSAYALNTLIHILPDPVITGIIGNEGKDQWGQVNQVFLYRMESEAGGNEVIVAFSALDPKTVTIPWEEDVAVLTDMYGVTRLVTAQNGSLTIEVGKCMQYISHLTPDTQA